MNTQQYLKKLAIWLPVTVSCTVVGYFVKAALDKGIYVVQTVPENKESLEAFAVSLEKASNAVNQFTIKVDSVRMKLGDISEKQTKFENSLEETKIELNDFKEEIRPQMKVIQAFIETANSQSSINYIPK